MEIQDDLIRKQQLREKTKKNEKQFQNFKNRNRYEHEDGLANNYRTKEMLRQKAMNEHAERIKQLESIESLMITELGAT